MNGGYGSHHDFMSQVRDAAAARQRQVESALREAFGDFIKTRRVEIIVFAEMTALDLARAIAKKPIILKPLLVCCNIAARALERDLDLRNVNTYSPRLSDEHANVIAGYISPSRMRSGSCCLSWEA